MATGGGGGRGCWARRGAAASVHLPGALAAPARPRGAVSAATPRPPTVRRRRPGSGAAATASRYRGQCLRAVCELPDPDPDPRGNRTGIPISPKDGCRHGCAGGTERHRERARCAAFVRVSLRCRAAGNVSRCTSLSRAAPILRVPPMGTRLSVSSVTAVRQGSSAAGWDVSWPLLFHRQVSLSKKSCSLPKPTKLQCLYRKMPVRYRHQPPCRNVRRSRLYQWIGHGTVKHSKATMCLYLLLNRGFLLQRKKSPRKGLEWKRGPTLPPWVKAGTSRSGCSSYMCVCVTDPCLHI